MDNADIATELAERERRERAEHDRRHSVDKPGPAFCIRCELWNDRGKDGYALCHDCHSYLNGGKAK